MASEISPSSGIGKRRSSGTSNQSSSDPLIEIPSTKPLNTYHSPIILTSNPWTTWVAWLCSSLICVSLCIMIIAMYPKLWYLSITIGTFAVALALHAKRENYTFDINSGRCTLKTISVLGREVQQYWFHEIKEVRLEESTDTQGGTEVDLYLVLRSGKKLNMLGGHLCGLEAHVKRQVWSDVSEYLHVSKSQNNLEFLEELQQAPLPSKTSSSDLVELDDIS
jgi:hypothetical protein